MSKTAPRPAALQIRPEIGQHERSLVRSIAAEEAQVDRGIGIIIPLALIKLEKVADRLFRYRVPAQRDDEIDDLVEVVGLRIWDIPRFCLLGWDRCQQCVEIHGQNRVFIDGETPMLDNLDVAVLLPKPEPGQVKEAVGIGKEDRNNRFVGSRRPVLPGILQLPDMKVAPFTQFGFDQVYPVLALEPRIDLDLDTVDLDQFVDPRERDRKPV